MSWLSGQEVQEAQKDPMDLAHGLGRSPDVPVACNIQAQGNFGDRLVFKPLGLKLDALAVGDKGIPP
jgi:hypothetical protein